MEGIKEINHFTDLHAWKKNHLFVKEVYKITASFPRTERFGLIDQLRRASASITANIAEGFGRYHPKDKLRFYYFSRGSNMECQNHLILARDLGYISDEIYKKLWGMVYEGYKVISGLIKSSRRFAER